MVTSTRDRRAGTPRDRAAEALRVELREYLGAVNAFDDAVARSLGIGRTDLFCLDLLARRGTMAAGALAEACRISTGAMTFAIDRLEEAGFVRRRRDAGDRRRVLVELVPAAHRRALRLHLPLIEGLRGLVDLYGNEELEVITDFLRRSRLIFERTLPPPCPRAGPRGAGERP